MVLPKVLTKLKPENNCTENDCIKPQQIPAVTENIEVLPKWKIITLNLTWFGLSLMHLLLFVEIMPAQLAGLVSVENKGICLGGMMAGGAVVMLLLGPLIGMWSDRLRLKSGKRQPLIIAGTVLISFGLIGMAVSIPDAVIFNEELVDTINGTCIRSLELKRCAPFNSSLKSQSLERTKSVLTHQNNHLLRINFPFAGNIFLYITFYLMVTSAFAIITVPYNAMVADKSHPSQRGFISGVLATSIFMGNVSGAALGTCYDVVGVVVLYILMVAIIIICVTITVLVIKEPISDQKPEPLNFKLIITGYYKPLKDHNFRWVFLTRFFMQQGVSTVKGFLEYWLDDMIYLPNCWTARTAVAFSLLPLFFFAAISSLIAGCISDIIKRRKPIIILSGILMTFAILGLLLTHGPYAFYFVVFLSVVFGTGFGAYQAVDFALAMDVLPDEEAKGKDMAVWHQAIILPQALATPIGGMVLDLFERVNCQIGLGYIMVFGLSGFYFLLSSIFVIKLKGVK